MRILWITNFLMPPLAQHLRRAKSVIGGWTYSAAEELKRQENIELAIACLYECEQIEQFYIDGIKYYIMPYRVSKLRYSSTMEYGCARVKEMFKPDVVHIYGSEYPLTLAYLNACGNDNVVISIQGVPAIYARYYFSGISFKDRLRYPVMFLQRKFFDKNNKFERQALSRCKYFEGRSDWDRAVSWSFNPKSKYFFCSRTLRPVFYCKEWCLDSMERHSIFLSQAQYSIKGLHQVLKALPFVVKQYPDVKVYIAGDSPYQGGSIKSYIKSLGYGAYVKDLIEKYNIKKYIEFIGLLNEQEICEQYLRANVFICPSAIENVPNSLAEAQILGTPCIASYVGGNASLIDEGQTGLLYRFEEFEMLAFYICEIFKDDKFALKLSYNGRKIALTRHNKENNINNLTNMYKTINQQHK